MATFNLLDSILVQAVVSTNKTVQWIVSTHRLESSEPHFNHFKWKYSIKQRTSPLATELVISPIVCPTVYPIVILIASQIVGQIAGLRTGLTVGYLNRLTNCY